MVRTMTLASSYATWPFAPPERRAGVRRSAWSSTGRAASDPSAGPDVPRLADDPDDLGASMRSSPSKRSMPALAMSS